jgi:hypothetical protein
MKIEINVTDLELVYIKELLKLNNYFQSPSVSRVETVLTKIIKQFPKRNLADVVKEKQSKLAK